MPPLGQVPKPIRADKLCERVTGALLSINRNSFAAGFLPIG